MELESKECYSCKEVKHHSLFYRVSKGKDKLYSYCKDCCKVRSKKYAQDNKDKIKTRLKSYHRDYYLKNKDDIKKKNEVYRLKTSYGLTPDCYESMLLQQGNKCAICKVEASELKSKLAVDHCHNHNYVRGLLCSNCNTALGSFKDSVENLNSAIEYLQHIQPRKVRSRV